MISRVPGSAREANNLVDHHDNLVKVAFEDARVQRLQNEGEAMLNSLQREEAHIGHSDDYRYGEFNIFNILYAGGGGGRKGHCQYAPSHVSRPVQRLFLS